MGAQRLEDSAKLKEAFDELMTRQLSDEENMVAFTAAPFLEDWKMMMKLGRKIEKMPGGMEQLHMMSLQLPIPDFTLIYDLCKSTSCRAVPLRRLRICAGRCTTCPKFASSLRMWIAAILNRNGKNCSLRSINKAMSNGKMYPTPLTST